MLRRHIAETEFQIVTLPRRDGPPYRIKASLASEVRATHPDGDQSVVALWQRSRGRWGVSVQVWDGRERLVDSQLVESPEKAVEFAEHCAIRDPGQPAAAKTERDRAAMLFARIRSEQAMRNLRILCDVARTRWIGPAQDSDL